MEIYESSFDTINRYRNYYHEIEYLLYERKCTLQEIVTILRSRNIELDEKIIYKILHSLLTNEKRILRHDHWDKEPIYEYLDKYYWDSSYQRSYYSLDSEEPKTQQFLLISDTHIGNEDIFNPRILHSIYDYAIKKGYKKCFHLGDLFDGNQSIGRTLNDWSYTSKNIEDLNNFEDEFKRQINIFINEYPKPTKEEMMTYGIIGNHDDILNKFLKTRDWWCASDLRNLTIYNEAFYMFPRDRIVTKPNDLYIHFNHRLYMSVIINNLKIQTVEDIEEEKKTLGSLMSDPHYDFFISGHLHRGVVHSAVNTFTQKSNLYLTVPSTSNLSLNRPIAFLVSLSPNKIAHIIILGCDNNYNTYEIDSFDYEFGKINENRSICL